MSVHTLRQRAISFFTIAEALNGNWNVVTVEQHRGKRMSVIFATTVDRAHAEYIAEAISYRTKRPYLPDPEAS